MTTTDFLFGVVVGFIVQNFWGAYLRRKGENAATREDLAELTRTAEGIKTELAQVVAEQRARHELRLQEQEVANQLRLAAVDERLKAHQEAYALWWHLNEVLFDDEKISGAVIACQEWWVRRNLYLSPTARSAFAAAYNLAYAHNRMVSQGREGGTVNREALEGSWKGVTEAGRQLVEAVALPDLGRKEPEPRARR